MEKNKRKTIGSIESFTGGLFASTVISKPGASAFFKGSVITYSNEIKEKLGVDTSNGVVNKKVALEMAKKGKEFLDVDICVSFTGEAGPESNEKPTGTVFIAINDLVLELFLEGTRNEIRQQAVEIAFKELDMNF